MKLTSNFVWAASLGGALAQASAQAGGKPVPYKVQTPPLDTDWTYKVGKNPWPEHPRPQLRRDDWQNLNGIWTYDGSGGAFTLAKPPTGQLGREIMIPSCVESALSGIQEMNATNMWFARDFSVPKEWSGSKVLLHLEAADYEATLYVNGIKAGNNTGGYFRFTTDVTDHIKFGQSNHL